MRTSIEALAAALAALAFSSAALACGICDEDRVAAVFDDATVKSTVEAKRHIAFFSIDGSLPATAASRKAVLEALYASGAVKGTARVSLESASTSAAFDPRKTSLDALQRAASARLEKHGLALTTLRLIDGSGVLSVPR